MRKLTSALYQLGCGLIGAMGFLTVLPIPSSIASSPAPLATAPLFFPLVGLLIGGIVACLDRVALVVFQPSGANGLVVIALAILTGGLHLDGVGDVADAIASRSEVKRKLEIMREPHIGAFAAIAIVSVLLMKYALLFGLSPHSPLRWRAIALTPSLARTAVLLPMAAFPYAHGEVGMGDAFQKIKQRTWLYAILCGVVLSWLIAGGLGCVVATAACAMALVIGYSFKLHFGGLTGDCYGAITELAECFIIGAFAIAGFGMGAQPLS